MTATPFLHPTVSAPPTRPKGQLAQADLPRCAAPRVRRLHRDGDGHGVAHPGRPHRSRLLPADPRLHRDRRHHRCRRARDRLAAGARHRHRGRGRRGGRRTRSRPPPAGARRVHRRRPRCSSRCSACSAPPWLAFSSSGVTLWFLDPEHHVRAVIIAVAVPVLLYLAFQTGLNAGLPQGILPIG